MIRTCWVVLCVTTLARNVVEQFLYGANWVAKLYFNFSAMNAGKSAILLQAAHNYQERGQRTLLLKPAIDTRDGETGRITSRVGLSARANLIGSDTDLVSHVLAEHNVETIACVLIDEAQFLTKTQVWQLAKLVDEHGLPVMCYGLRTDFQGALFPGSAALLAIADSLSEIRAICWCGRKATMNLRVDEKGQAITDGDQVEIGGNERYLALCRKHFLEAGGRIETT